ncbi:Uncharacterised protein [Acholeplasma oculi]|uniref:Uncharacterized protein n=1 Tax=Acholeplasma oculi TaxID=35623 RepID=A0A061A9H6_9MOLU|nr:hypothetical protein [Acholeplasma oculi]CDR30513.1 hypothetical protein Aocu_04400 [Acholeplasma oculi]SKC47741.1 hypothetical protein SAMN02745122_1312 [Acholeplasma oculi]SUT89160.1 Uncharacterised protein [Acholeplasma oculi]
MDKLPINAEQIFNHVSERWKESIFRKENIIVDFKLNDDGIVFLIFANTGRRPVYLKNIKINREWIRSVLMIIPDFEANGRLNITLNEIKEYRETIFPLQSVAFPLFHFYYTFKPWYIPRGDAEHSNINRDEMIEEESLKLNERCQKIDYFYKSTLEVSFKISKLNIFRHKVYIKFNKRVDVSKYYEEIESKKFDNRGKRIINE